VLCVKPQQVRGVLEEIRSEISPEHVLISTCAGVSIDALQGGVPQTRNIARAMPNIACEINQGVTAICFSAKWERDDREDVVRLFDAIGKTVILDERHFDSVTAVSGCGPAYACVIIEALTDAGVKQGLPRDAARVLVAQTLVGSALMVLTSEKHPAQIRDRVTTPGGCTIDALTALEDGKLRSTLISAVGMAASKSSTLANGMRH
jgi:pyrroline-5-carboxylate reductase